jgi:hypothetical protein
LGKLDYSDVVRDSRADRDTVITITVLYTKREWPRIKLYSRNLLQGARQLITLFNLQFTFPSSFLAFSVLFLFFSFLNNSDVFPVITVFFARTQ